MAKKTNSSAQKRRAPKKEKAVEVQAVVQEKKPAAKRGEEGIDVVVPMVFPGGGKWLEGYRKACAEEGIEPKIDERLRSWDLERYFFRGIAKFMPFVRKIHLIVSDESQVPFWIDKEKVHIVLHEDIIPKELLPTFNSSTIEMWLHRIDGLSETFIYCNDDMIATSPLTGEDFFIDGKPVTRCTERRVDTNIPFMKMCRTDLEIAAKDNGKKFDEGIILRDGHSYAPLLLSVLNETVEKHGKEMYDSCTTFRKANNLNQYLYTLEQWLGGKCVNGHHAHRYFTLETPYGDMSEIVLSGTAGVVCFNDGGIGSWTEMKAVVWRDLQTILGEKCEYEV